MAKKEDKENKALLAALGKLNTSVTLQNQEVGKWHQTMSESLGVFSVIGGYIKELISFGPAMDTLGAKFSTSIQGNISESQKLADAFVKNGVPASVWDAVSFNLHTNSLALDATSEGLRDLFGVTMATGENYTALAKALGSVTVGTKNQKKSLNELAATLEDTAKRTNMSRESLIGAMAKLSDNTLNLMAATAGGNTALTGAMAILKGQIGDEGLVNQMSSAINRMMTPEGFTAALQAGFPMFDLMKITDPHEMADELRKMFEAQASRAQKEFVSQMFFSENAKKHLGDINLAARLTNKFAENTLKEQKDINKGFEKTWDILKKELVRPLVDTFKDLFFQLKDKMGGNVGKIIKNALLGVGLVVAGIAKVIVKLFAWFADIFMDVSDQASEWMAEGILKLNGIKADLSKNQENTKIIADIQKDRRKEETNKNLSDAIRTQTKLSIHQTKVTPVLLKQLIALQKKHTTMMAGKNLGGSVNVTTTTGTSNSVHALDS